MENISKVYRYTFELLGHQITIDPANILMTWLVMGLLTIFAIFVARGLRTIPGPVQAIAESVYEFVDDLTVGTLGKQKGNMFVPFIFMIFTFILISNWIGVIPNLAKILGICIAAVHGVFSLIFGSGAGQVAVEGFSKIMFSPNPATWYYPLFTVPDFIEPTRSVNTDLALGIMVFVVVHVNSIWNKGFIEYIKQYWGDVIPCHGYWLLLAPINVMIIINIIGELSSVVSHSFRLFGNILGGFMIITIVSSLVKFIGIPVLLLGFFGLFAGLVQAFVFTMLAR